MLISVQFYRIVSFSRPTTIVIVFAWFKKMTLWNERMIQRSLFKSPKFNTKNILLFRFGRRPKNQLLPLLVQSVVRSSEVRFCQRSGRTNVFHRKRQLPRPLRLHEQLVTRSRRQETAVTLRLSSQTLSWMVSRMVRRSEKLSGMFNPWLDNPT